LIESGDIILEHRPTSLMMADFLTKALARIKVEEFIKMAGLMDGKRGSEHGRLREREVVGNVSDIYALVSRPVNNAIMSKCIVGIRIGSDRITPRPSSLPWSAAPVQKVRVASTKRGYTRKKLVWKVANESKVVRRLIPKTWSRPQVISPAHYVLIFNLSERFKFGYSLTKRHGVQWRIQDRQAERQQLPHLKAEDRAVLGIS
jgi:hypothetical protein